MDVEDWSKPGCSTATSEILSSDSILTGDKIDIINKCILKNKELIIYLCNLEATFVKQLAAVRSELATIKPEDSDKLYARQQAAKSTPMRRPDPSVDTSSFSDDCGMPYFKKPGNIPAVTANPVSVIDPTRHWTKCDKEQLIRVIKTWEIERYERECKSVRDLLQIQMKNTTDPTDLQLLKDEYQKLARRNIAGMDLKDLLETSKEDYNWDLVAAKLRYWHTPMECKNMWNIYLHPKFNKCFWTSKEDHELIELAAKHGKQNWEAIASELGTGRSAYSCFIHFQSRLNDGARKSSWTPEEDKRLAQLAQTHSSRSGSVVNWRKVMPQMPGRTRSQVITHWCYTLDPSIKRGHFSRQEKKILLSGIRTYGNDWARIRQRCLPERTVVQIREHVRRWPAKLRRGSWQPEEDALLLELVEKYGRGKWSQVQKHFCDRNRTQIRFRYATLSKGPAERKHRTYTVTRRPNQADKRLCEQLSGAMADADNEGFMALTTPEPLPVAETRKVGRKRKQDPSSLDYQISEFLRTEKREGPFPRRYYFTSEILQEATENLQNCCLLLDAKIKVPLVDVIRKHVKSFMPNAIGLSSLPSESSTSTLIPSACPSPPLTVISPPQLPTEPDNNCLPSTATNTQTLTLPVDPLTELLTGLSFSQYVNHVQPHHQSIQSVICTRGALNTPPNPAKELAHESPSIARSSVAELPQSEWNAGIYSDLNERGDHYCESNNVLPPSFETTSEPTTSNLSETIRSNDLVLNREAFPKSYCGRRILYLFPPNVATLNGVRASMHAMKKLDSWAKKGSPCMTAVSRRGAEAEQRWTNRCQQLFLIPHLMSQVAPRFTVDSDKEEEVIEKPRRGRPPKRKKVVTRPKRKYVFSGKFKVTQNVNTPAFRSLRRRRVGDSDANEGSNNGRAVKSKYFANGNNVEARGSLEDESESNRERSDGESTIVDRPNGRGQSEYEDDITSADRKRKSYVSEARQADTGTSLAACPARLCPNTSDSVVTVENARVAFKVKFDQFSVDDDVAASTSTAAGDGSDGEAGDGSDGEAGVKIEPPEDVPVRRKAGRPPKRRRRGKATEECAVTRETNPQASDGRCTAKEKQNGELARVKRKRTI